MISNYLRAATDEELRAELQRRKDDKPPPLPAGRCGACGAVWYFGGTWSAPNFERQHARFAAAHQTCPMSIDGAGI